jgi:Fe-S cluster biogenesis protein NfuA
MSRIVHRLGAAAAVALTSRGSAPGCTSTCNGVGCIQSVTITPEHSLSDPGDYEVDFVADGFTSKCTLTVPSSIPAKCSDERAFVSQQSGRGIAFVSIDGDYKTVTVTILRDGTTVTSRTFSPKYEDIALDGACETCPTATETLKLGVGLDGGTEADAGG